MSEQPQKREDRKAPKFGQILERLRRRGSASMYADLPKEFDNVTLLGPLDSLGDAKGRCTKSLERNVLPSQVFAAMESKPKLMSRPVSFPDFLDLTRTLDDAIKKISKRNSNRVTFQLLDSDLKDDPNEDLYTSSEEDEVTSPTAMKSQEMQTFQIHPLDKSGIKRSSTFSLRPKDNKDRMSGTAAERLGNRFQQHLKSVVDRLEAFPDSSEKLLEIQEILKLLERLKNEVKINSHFAILTTIMEPIEEHTETSDVKRDFSF